MNRHARDLAWGKLDAPTYVCHAYIDTHPLSPLLMYGCGRYNILMLNLIPKNSNL